MLPGYLHRWYKKLILWISCPKVGSLGDNVRSNRRARPRFSFVSKCCSSPSREWYLFTWCHLTGLENGRARTIPVYLCASFFGVEFPGHWCCACTTGLQMPAYFPKWLCQFPLPPLMSDSLFVPWSTNKGNWTSIAYIKPAEGVSTGENSQRWHEYKWVGLLLRQHTTNWGTLWGSTQQTDVARSQTLG